MDGRLEGEQLSLPDHGAEDSGKCAQGSWIGISYLTKHSIRFKQTGLMGEHRLKGLLMARLSAVGAIEQTTAVVAITLAAISNTVLKMIFVATLASRAMRRSAFSVLGVVALTGLAAVLFLIYA